MDLVAGGEGVEVFGLVEVPEHGGAVFAAGGAEGAVGRDGHRVDVACVANVVGLDAAGGEFPNLCSREWVSQEYLASDVLRRCVKLVRWSGHQGKMVNGVVSWPPRRL